MTLTLVDLERKVPRWDGRTDLNKIVTILIILAGGTLGPAGCNLIGFNKPPVTTIDKDSHDAKGTNVNTFDTTISPC